MDAKDVTDERTLEVQLSAELPKTASVHFVCSNGKTAPGEATYVLGNIAELGAWDPAKAIRLTPVRYPKWSRWSATMPGLRPSTELEWKFIKPKESGGPQLAWDVDGANHRITSPSTGFTGTTRARFADQPPRLASPARRYYEPCRDSLAALPRTLGFRGTARIKENDTERKFAARGPTVSPPAVRVATRRSPDKTLFEPAR
jgi:hypothetical protein